MLEKSPHPAAQQRCDDIQEPAPNRYERYITKLREKCIKVRGPETNEVRLKWEAILRTARGSSTPAEETSPGPKRSITEGPLEPSIEPYQHDQRLSLEKSTPNISSFDTIASPGGVEGQQTVPEIMESGHLGSHLGKRKVGNVHHSVDSEIPSKEQRKAKKQRMSEEEKKVQKMKLKEEKKRQRKEERRRPKEKAKRTQKMKKEERHEGIQEGMDEEVKDEEEQEIADLGKPNIQTETEGMGANVRMGSNYATPLCREFTIILEAPQFDGSDADGDDISFPPAPLDPLQTTEAVANSPEICDRAKVQELSREIERAYMEKHMRNVANALEGGIFGNKAMEDLWNKVDGIHMFISKDEVVRTYKELAISYIAEILQTTMPSKEYIMDFYTAETWKRRFMSPSDRLGDADWKQMLKDISFFCEKTETMSTEPETSIEFIQGVLFLWRGAMSRRRV